MLTKPQLLAPLFMLMLCKEGFPEPEKHEPGYDQFHICKPVKPTGILHDTVPQTITKAPWFVERFRLKAGLFVPVNNTSVQVSVAGGKKGTIIDLENDLGFSRTVGTFEASFEWRISRRSRISAYYYNIARSSDYTLKKDIVFDTTTFSINTTVEAYFNTAIYQVSYGYAILAKPDFEVGILIGAHTVGFGTGIAEQGPNSRVDKSSDYNFTVPLPDLGLWGNFVLSKRFALGLEASYLAMTLDQTYGSILTYNFQFLYKLGRRLDISLGYTGLNFEVDKTIRNSECDFTWGYSGPSISVIYSFGKNNWDHSTTFDGR